jgi:hypothetical protein
MGSNLTGAVCVTDRSQFIVALKQQMLKEIRESQGEKSMNSCLLNGSPGETIA